MIQSSALLSRGAESSAAAAPANRRAGKGDFMAAHQSRVHPRNQALETETPGAETQNDDRFAHPRPAKAHTGPGSAKPRPSRRSFEQRLEILHSPTIPHRPGAVVEQPAEASRRSGGIEATVEEPNAD